MDYCLFLSTLPGVEDRQGVARIAVATAEAFAALIDGISDRLVQILSRPKEHIQSESCLVVLELRHMFDCLEVW